MNRHYLARYTLSDGTRGALHVVSVHSFDVIDMLVRSFSTLRSCSARCL
ncbi:hypothetical protein [Rhizobacter sp. P5_C2]